MRFAKNFVKTAAYRTIRGIWYEILRWIKFIEEKRSSGYFSQYGEDVAIEKFFGNLINGFYVDIGSGHPILDSNTFYFYRRLNWSGVAVDAMKSNFILHKLLRHRDKAYWASIGSNSDPLNVYEYPVTAFTTTDQRRYEELKLNGMFPSVVRQVPGLTLQSLLLYRTDICMQKCFMTIDVEGGEHDVLLGNDWVKFSPVLICVEDISDSNKEVQNLLEVKGYKQISRETISNIWINENLGHLRCGDDSACKVINFRN